MQALNFIFASKTKVNIIGKTLYTLQSIFTSFLCMSVVIYTTSSIPGTSVLLLYDVNFLLQNTLLNIKTMWLWLFPLINQPLLILHITGVPLLKHLMEEDLLKHKFPYGLVCCEHRGL